ncbi:MAG: helix-turn-helix transcriptional regulator [Chloroflexota bacterium]|nr:helix-turn-helix transcriptional regulator [Chloroflexota bacterium]
MEGTVGARLLEALQRAGVARPKLAEALDVSRQAVDNWIHGRSAPSREHLIGAARLLGVDPRWLVGESVDQPGQQEDGSPTGTDVPHMEAGGAEDLTNGMGAAATRGEVDMLRRQVADLIGEVALLRSQVSELMQVSRRSGPDEGAGGG